MDSHILVCVVHQEIQIDQLPDSVFVLAGLMQVEHLDYFYLRVDDLEFCFEIFELVVERDIFDQQSEMAKQFFIEVCLLADSIEEDFDSQGSED